MGMKSNSGFFKGTLGNPVVGDVSLMSDKELFAKYIRKRKDIDPNGRFDLIAHGSTNHIELEHNGKKLLVDSRTVAKLLKNMPNYKKGQEIRLLSCNTGYLNVGFAQNLANKLNVVVWAPSSYLWAYSSGNYLIADRIVINGQEYPDMSRKGKFLKFIPGGNNK